MTERKAREIETIERDIAALRADLDATLDRLEAKLSPKYFIATGRWKKPLVAAVASFGVKWAVSAWKKRRRVSR